MRTASTNTVDSGREQAEVRGRRHRNWVWHVMKMLYWMSPWSASQQSGVQVQFKPSDSVRLSVETRGLGTKPRDHQCSEGGKQRETMKRYGEREAGEV